MNRQKLSVLLIEDNLALGKQVCHFLEGLGWQVDYADKGQHGLALALAHHFDVILLDLNLPDCDGLTICQTIKQKQTRMTPVLMLTARDAFEDKARGFSNGTDDYLTKPFDLRELAMRCEALARRPGLHSDTILKKGHLSLDARTYSVTWNDKPVKTTKIGFKILYQLTDAYPYSVARSDLIANLWGNQPPESNALKSHMYSLRKALHLASERTLLKTISNIGYQLEALEQLSLSA